MSNFKATATGWTWSCVGANGGTTVAGAAKLASNGSCGASSGTSLTSAPATGLCSTGTASSISGTGPWNWSCAGSNGGTNASCSAALKPAAVNGICGASNGASLSSAPTTGLCTVGIASTIAGSGPWMWNCVGSNGGTMAQCSAALKPVAVNGSCGASNGTDLTSAPTTGLCSTGTASSITGPGPWNWTCAGFNGGTSANCAAELDNQVVLFQQPDLPGIVSSDSSSNFLIPGATHIPVPYNRFYLVDWEGNPATSNGLLTPGTWNAGTKTGLVVDQPYGQYEEAYNNTGNPVSTAQIEHTAVGVYMNSADLAGSIPYNGVVDPTFIITPGEQFSASPTATSPGHVQIFQYPASGLTVSMDLQVPTAVDEGVSSGCSTYVFMDLGFSQTDTTNLVTYDVGLFFDGQGPNSYPQAALFYDPRSQNYVLDTLLVPNNPYVTYVAGSAIEQEKPWSGFQPFIYTISYANFQAGLQKLAATYPNQSLSTNPSDYTFTNFHLNAEMQYLNCKNPSVPVELGWSMRNQKLIWDRP